MTREIGMRNSVTSGAYTIDRFEDGGWAVLEDSQARTFTIPRAWLSPSVREGDGVRCDWHDAPSRSRVVSFTVDAGSRAERLERARASRDSLPSGPKGDMSL